MLLALATFVSASLTIPNVILGGDSQTKSNPDEHDDQFTYTQATFSITNTGNASVNNILLSSTAANDFNVTFTPAIISSLAAHASQSVVITAKVPENLDTFFENRANPVSNRVNTIGNIIASASGGVSAQSTLQMQAKNNLILDRVYVSINGQSKKGYTDGSNVKDIRPGDRLTIEVRVKNRNAKSENLDYGDVSVDLESQNSDFDLSDTLDYSSVSANNVKSESLSFTVDASIDEDTYTVTFTLTGQDDLNSNGGDQWTIDFEVNKQDQDIVIKSAVLSQSTVSCDRNVNLNINLDNIGNDDSDEVVLQWESDALGIKNQQLAIDLNSGDTYFKSLPLTISPDQRAGTYSIRVMTFFDYSAFQDQDINNFAEASLVVQDCVTTITCYECVSGNIVSNEYQAKACPSGTSLTIPQCQQPVKPQNTTVVVTPTTPVTPTVPAPVTYTSSNSNVLYISLIVLGYLVVLIVGIALISYMLRRR
ncbi:MAG: hypothetical protein V1837_01195 [Candidatus Woesearchaeota archaeon]